VVVVEEEAATYLVTGVGTSVDRSLELGKEESGAGAC
jgi:hypothetical protein